MKKLFSIMTMITIIFLTQSCKKDISGFTLDSNVKNIQSQWDQVINNFESNKSLTSYNLEYLQKRMVEIDAPNIARCDSSYMPTLMGSGGTLVFQPNCLEVYMGTLWFFYPPRNVSAIIIFKAKWIQNGVQKTKTLYTIARKLGDPYDIGVLYMNDLKIDYNTQYTAETWALSACGTRYNICWFGPYQNTSGNTKQSMKFGRNR